MKMSRKKQMSGGKKTEEARGTAVRKDRENHTVRDMANKESYVAESMVNKENHVAEDMGNKGTGTVENTGNGIAAEKKQYDFISEDIMPTPKTIVKGSKTRLVALVLCLAVFFGILASISYAITNGIFDYIAKKNDESNREAIHLSGNDAVSEEPIVFSDISELVKAADRAVVRIQAVTKSDDGLFSDKLTSSEEYFGVVIYDDGTNYYILSGYSRLKSAPNLRVVFQGNAAAESRIVGYDEDLDLAVLVVNYSNYYMENFSNVEVLDFAASGSVVKGSTVVAVGAPNGIIGSIDYGIVTGTDNMYPLADISLNICTTNMNYYEKSAGVVLNMRGRICGILTDVYADNKVPSFISTDNLLPLIEQMANDISLLYTGAVCEDVSSDILENAGCENGIYVQKVEEGSPADTAGLRSGDIIVSVGNKKIFTVDDYTEKVYSVGYEGTMELAVKRNHTDMKITVTVGK